MSRHGIAFFVFAADVVAVVDNGLRAVDEVAGGFPFHFGTCICKVASCDSIYVQCRQRVVLVKFIRPYLMHVLGIDEAAAHAGLHVDEVELYNARDVAPVLLIQVVASALLSRQLQIDTGCQRHLVLTGAVVALAVVDESGFPVVESSFSVILGSNRSAAVVVCF